MSMQWWTLQQLKSRNSQTRRQAVEKLAEEKSEAALDYLLPALQDDDAEVRLAVVKGLGRSQEPRGLPPLIQAMRDPSAEIREAVVAALGQRGDATCIEVLVARSRICTQASAVARPRLSTLSDGRPPTTFNARSGWRLWANISRRPRSGRWPWSRCSRRCATRNAPTAAWWWKP